MIDVFNQHKSYKVRCKFDIIVRTIFACEVVYASYDSNTEIYRNDKCHVFNNILESLIMILDNPFMLNGI